MKMSTRRLVISALVAAIYTVLTLLLAPISFGPVQFRAAEALYILPFFFPYTSIGLFVGCILSNLLGGLGILDIVFGSLATLLAALAVARLGKKSRGAATGLLFALVPAAINGIIVGAVIALASTPGSFFVSMPVFALQVFVGEAVVLLILGLPLMHFLPKTKLFNMLRVQ